MSLIKHNNLHKSLPRHCVSLQSSIIWIMQLLQNISWKHGYVPNISSALSNLFALVAYLFFLYKYECTWLLACVGDDLFSRDHYCEPTAENEPFWVEKVRSLSKGVRKKLSGSKLEFVRLAQSIKPFSHVANRWPKGTHPGKRKPKGGAMCQALWIGRNSVAGLTHLN